MSAPGLVQVREEVLRVLRGETGRLYHTRHALLRMQERGISTVDVANILRGGRYRVAEEQGDDARYIAETARYRVVFCLERHGDVTVVVVTVIDRRR